MGRQDKTYQINGKAVADSLSSGDFEIDALQLAGNVMAPAQISAGL